MLRQMFNFIGSYGIIGPHAGYEAKLMLAGVKPIAQLPVLSPDIPDTEMDAGCRQMRKDCKELTEAAENGLLSTYDAQMPEKYGGMILRFFAQPEHSNEMIDLARAHEKWWDNPDYKMNDLEKDPGEYLGYTSRDVDLFQAKQKWPAYVPSCLHGVLNDVKRYCRVQSLLMEAKDNTETNPSTSPLTPTAQSPPY